MSKYKYDILSYWDNGLSDLYVHYIVEDKDSKKVVDTVEYYSIYDVECDFYTSTEEEIKNDLKKLLQQNDGVEFKYPKISDTSPLLQYVYDWVCDSDADMCHIGYDDWEDIKDDAGFSEKDISLLKKEIKKYDLEDYIWIDDGEYKICGYGGLQCCFNDDRSERVKNIER